MNIRIIADLVLKRESRQITGSSNHVAFLAAVLNVIETLRLRRVFCPAMVSLRRGAMACVHFHRASSRMTQRLRAGIKTGTLCLVSALAKSITICEPRLTQATAGPKSA